MWFLKKKKERERENKTDIMFFSAQEPCLDKSQIKY